MVDRCNPSGVRTATLLIPAAHRLEHDMNAAVRSTAKVLLEVIDHALTQLRKLENDKPEGGAASIYEAGVRCGRINVIVEQLAGLRLSLVGEDIAEHQAAVAKGFPEAPSPHPLGKDRCPPSPLTSTIPAGRHAGDSDAF